MDVVVLLGIKVAEPNEFRNALLWFAVWSIARESECQSRCLLSRHDFKRVLS